MVRREAATVLQAQGEWDAAALVDRFKDFVVASHSLKDWLTESAPGLEDPFLDALDSERSLQAVQCLAAPAKRAVVDYDRREFATHGDRVSGTTLSAVGTVAVSAPLTVADLAQSTPPWRRPKVLYERGARAPASWIVRGDVVVLDWFLREHGLQIRSLPPAPRPARAELGTGAALDLCLPLIERRG